MTVFSFSVCDLAIFSFDKTQWSYIVLFVVRMYRERDETQFKLTPTHDSFHWKHSYIRFDGWRWRYYYYMHFVAHTHTQTEEWWPNGRIDVRCGKKDSRKTRRNNNKNTRTDSERSAENRKFKHATNCIDFSDRTNVGKQCYNIIFCFVFGETVFTERKAHNTYFSSRGWQWCAAFQDGESDTLLRFARLTNDEFRFICAEADVAYIQYWLISMLDSYVRLFGGGGMRGNSWWNVTEHTTAESTVQRRTQ